MLSRAHVAIRSMYEEEAFGLRALSLALGVYPQTLRYILTGTTPKVTLALAIQRELGIDVNDWAIPARVDDHP
jgi:lambda repressor-like predicted transcriptional regulator